MIAARSGRRISIATGFAMLCAGLVAGPWFENPLHALLIAVPGTCLALAAIARDLSPSGRTGPGLSGHAVAAALLAALTLSAPALGIDGIDALIAGAWVILLGHAVLQLAPALYRHLRSTRRPSVHFALVPLLVYLAAASWGLALRPPDGDEPYYLLLAHSLATDADVDLSDEYADASWQRFVGRPLEPQPGDPRGADGAVFSRHNFLLPLLLMPLYALGGRAGAAAAIALMASALAWLVARMAMRIETNGAPPASATRPAFLVWALVAFTPPLLLYSHQIWIEVPAALAFAIAVDRLWLLRADRPRRRDVAILAAAVATLPLLKLRFGLLAIPIVILAWQALRGRAGAPDTVPDKAPDVPPTPAARRAILGVVAALVLAVGGLLVRNQLLFGNPLKIHDLAELALVGRPPLAFVLGASGLFFDCAFGLFAAAPIWLLLLPAIGQAARQKHTLLRDAAVIGLPYLAILSPRLEWFGGWSPPFRYAVVLLPLLGLLLVPLFTRRSAGLRALAAGLTLISALLASLWLAVPGWTYNLADGGSHLLDAASTRLGADVGRFFPSMIRPRIATWAWPLAAAALAPLAFVRRPRRRAGLWGVVAAICAIALVPVFATTLRTHTIELEDGYVRTAGGHLSPRPWTLERPRYRGGWTLRTGSHVTAPVVGEGTVRLRLAVRFIINAPERPLSLDVSAGEQHLARLTASAHQVWQIFDVEHRQWPRGANLVLEAQGEHRSGAAVNGVVIDYVDFHWD